MTRLRWRVAPLLALAFEAYLYRGYVELDAVLHYWLHSLMGAVVGIAALTLVALVRRRTPRGVWAAGAGGHLFSAVPDVLFLVAGILHVRWMDVFVLHITVHFVPVPLATLFALFVAVLGAWVATLYGRRLTGAVTLAAVAVVTIAALMLADDPPDSLRQLREEPRLALVCPLAPQAQLAQR